MLKLENKYDTVNKTYFKEMKYVDWFSWKKYSGGDDRMSTLLHVGTYMGMIIFFFMGGLVNAIAFIPSFIFFAIFAANLTKSVDEEYKELNSSYLVQLEGDDKPKYYSKWYLEMTNAFEYEKKIETRWVYYQSLIDLYFKEIKEQLPENSIISKEYITSDSYCSYILNVEYMTPVSKFIQVERESDRKHWKNNIPENRVLTWSEYKKYKKGKLKQQELLEQAEYIKEFKEYYGLEVKEIEEIIK